MSPQWFETWRFNARNEVGDPITFRTHFSLPTTISAGLAFQPIDRLLLVADVRWFDYRTTQLLCQPVRDGGANWDSIWAVAVGGRIKVTDWLSFQAGYLFNENPISENLAVFNTM